MIQYSTGVQNQLFSRVQYSKVWYSTVQVYRTGYSSPVRLNDALPRPLEVRDEPLEDPLAPPPSPISHSGASGGPVSMIA